MKEVKVILEFKVPPEMQATNSQISEWIRYHIGQHFVIRESNPLADIGFDDLDSMGLDVSIIING